MGTPPVTPMHVGPLRISPPLVLAPMAGVTDQVFRLFCKRYGASLVYTEMISALGLKYASKRTRTMMELHPEEHPVVIQIFGADPEAMGDAARQAEAVGAAAVDINMACPVPKVTKGGGGSAMMGEPELALQVFRAVRDAVTVPVTVKLRSGLRTTDQSGVDLAIRLAEEGAAAIAMHPRSAIRRYHGLPDRGYFRELRERLPRTTALIGSGDIFTAEDANEAVRVWGCDGVMIARGCLGDFWIFERAAALLRGESPPPPPSPARRLQVTRGFIEEMAREYGEERGLRRSRKHLLWLLKGVPGAAAMRSRAATASTIAELEAFIDEAQAFIAAR